VSVRKPKVALWSVPAVGLVAAVAFAHANAVEAGNREVCDAEGHADDHGAVHQKRNKFESLPDVTLSSKVEEKLSAIGEKYQRRTAKTFIVTSGIRDPDSQAELIYRKLSLGEDLLKLYKDKSAVRELKEVFDEGRKTRRSRPHIVTQLATVIRAQMKRGIFISAHLKAGAADIRSSSMTPAEKRAFIEAARDVGGFSIMLESTPPHFHLQLE
jgi:hypothetical protein